jgi:hypothetical protein
MGREGEPPAGRWGAQVSATIFSADIPDIRHCGELAVVRWKSALTSQQPQVLAERTAPVIDSDRQFFERHPRRRYRVRDADPIEVALRELSTGEAIMKPPGRKIFVVVSNIAPDVRMQFFVDGPETGGTDLTEAQARFVFEIFVSEHLQEIEARARKACRGGSGLIPFREEAAAA